MKLMWSPLLIVNFNLVWKELNVFNIRSKKFFGAARRISSTYLK